MCIGDTAQTTDLCTTCWEQTASAEELSSGTRFMELVATGKCKYCGNPAAGGSFSGGLMMEERVDLWCEPCGSAFSEFMARPENVIDQDSPDDEAAMEQQNHRVAALLAAAEEYVRQTAVQRRMGPS
jgi:hypothetical protein